MKISRYIVFPLLLIVSLTVSSCNSKMIGSGLPANAEMQALISAAQKDGTLVVIGQPRDWCNYGDVMNAFESEFGIKIRELNADANSEQRIAAMRQDNSKQLSPDVIDVGYAFIDSAKSNGLLLPYKVSTWDSIPKNLKDPDGFWFGGYYAVMSFLVNTRVQPDVPKDWSDLLGEKYKNQVALYGDPRSSNHAIQSVYAAALANGGSLDNAEPGLEFFSNLNKKGNLVPLIANSLLVARGTTPVLITWDQYAQNMNDSFAGNPPAQVIIPTNGRIANLYVQAINAHAKHLNAAKLWMEFLYSDAGQLNWMQGYCHPVREADLRARGVIPQSLAGKFPEINNVIFPSVEQLQNAKEIITTQWDSVVGVDIQPAP